MTSPLLKWTGGKREMVDQLLAMVFGPRGPWREGSVRRRYIEPFLGGAALALAMPGDVDVVASDVEIDLVETYETVRYSPLRVSAAVELHRDAHSTAHYYEVRAAVPYDAVSRAARIIYLNKTCFNGLWRKNRSGQFNVPVGRGRATSLPGMVELLTVSRTMRRWSIRWCDFEQTIGLAREGDVVYADPPYVGTHDYSSSFGADDQERLRDVLDAAYARGASVITTNSIAAAGLYAGRAWRTADVAERRRVSANASNRPDAACLLAWRFW